MYGNFGENFSSNCTGIFLGTKNRNGIELYNLQNTDMKPGASNPNKWYRKFRPFNGKNGKKVIAIRGGRWGGRGELGGKGGGGGEGERETRSGTEK